MAAENAPKRPALCCDSGSRGSGAPAGSEDDRPCAAEPLAGCASAGSRTRGGCSCSKESSTAGTALEWRSGDLAGAPPHLRTPLGLAALLLPVGDSAALPALVPGAAAALHEPQQVPTLWLLLGPALKPAGAAVATNGRSSA